MGPSSRYRSLALFAASLSLAVGPSLTVSPVGGVCVVGDPADERRRPERARCGAPTPTKRAPREPTKAEVAAEEKRARKTAKAAEQAKRAAKGGPDAR